MQLKEIQKRINRIPDKIDKEEFKKEFGIILQGMKKVAEGFLDIAESVSRIKEKKLYREIGFETFERFCNEILGLTRKTVYVYIRIAEITKKFPSFFKKNRVLLLGPRKMDLITSGITKIENSKLFSSVKIKRIEKISNEIDVKMTVGEIENIVVKNTRNLNL